MRSLENSVDVSAIRERLNQLSAGDVARWGEMNVVEMVCHLRGAYAYPLGEGQAKLMPGRVPPGVMKWFALALPVRWPKGVPTVPSLRIGGAGMKPVAFEEDHRTLLEVFERFCALQAIEKFHSIFGSMRHRDWMRWGYLHADHHLRQFGR